MGLLVFGVGDCERRLYATISPWQHVRLRELSKFVRPSAYVRLFQRVLISGHRFLMLDLGLLGNDAPTSVSLDSFERSLEHLLASMYWMCGSFFQGTFSELNGMISGSLPAITWLYHERWNRPR